MSNFRGALHFDKPSLILSIYYMSSGLEEKVSIVFYVSFYKIFLQCLLGCL